VTASGECTGLRALAGGEQLAGRAAARAYRRAADERWVGGWSEEAAARPRASACACRR
jgi:hypothetical protein